MTFEITRPVGFGLGAVLVVIAAVWVAVARHDHVATVAVAPLSATDRRVLSASRPLITALPAALRQVPQAASDASHGTVTAAQARAVLARTPALSALSAAVDDPASVTSPLLSAYDAVATGRSPGSVDAIVPALQQLQTVEGQIEPAIRVIAAHGGAPPAAATALSALGNDRRTTTLAHLVLGWQQVYGAFTLVEQQAAQ